jgi:serine/threonine-protein kinase
MTTEAAPICPECGDAATSPDISRCPTHGLCLLPPAVAARHQEHPLLGRVLDDKYALVDVIGSGGFGAVYRALQFPMKRTVAVKVLLGAAFAQKLGRERFEREAEALARLDSRHTVRLIDFGITQANAGLGALPYMVMEYLKGEGLDARLGHGRLTFDEMAAVVGAVSESLAEAHALGIVHRDLKPSNILLTRTFDGQLLPKVIDFGIARVTGAVQSESGVITGTPRYMAPEQIVMDRPPDGRVDVYALGVICYELITGFPPFNAENSIALLRAHVEAPIPSIFAGGGVSASLGAVDPVIARALAKMPDERYPGAAALARDFVAALAQAGVLGGGPGGVPSVTTAPRAESVAPSTPLVVSNISQANAGLMGRDARRAPRWAAVAAVGASAAAVVGAWLLSGENAPSEPIESTAVSAAPVIAAPSVQAPVAVTGARPVPPLTVASEPPLPPPTTPAPESTGRIRPVNLPVKAPERGRQRTLAAEIDTALGLCRCQSARALLAELRRQTGGELAGALDARVAACRDVDVDHKCVAGRLEEVP